MPAFHTLQTWRRHQEQHGRIGRSKETDIATDGNVDPVAIPIPSDPTIDVAALAAKSPWRL
jgi:hypothetical protein